MTYKERVREQDLFSVEKKIRGDLFALVKYLMSGYKDKTRFRGTW